MKDVIAEQVEFFVQFVCDFAVALSGGKPANDLIQAKAIFVEAARKIDRSSRSKAPKQEREVDNLFMEISLLQGGRFKDDKDSIGVLCFSYFSVGHLVGKLMRNWELSALGKSGARKRYAPMRDLEAWTLSEYRIGNWKSANQAAHALKDAVLAQSRTLEANLTESNAQRTIAEWINRDKKTV